MPVFVNQKSLICSTTDCKTLKNVTYRNHPTFLLNIAQITFFKRKIAANKSCENFVSGIHFYLIGMQKCILSIKWFTKGEIFPSCFNFDLNRSASKKKMCSKMSIFKRCGKTFRPL